MNGNIIKSKLLFALFVFMQTFCSVYAQNSGFNLKGRACERDGKSGIGYATVKLYNNTDSVSVYRGVADEAGAFSIGGVAAGSYRVKVTCVGYENYVARVNVGGDTDMGIIKLNEDKNMLDGVTVMAEYSKVKPTGDVVVQVKGNPMAKGKTLVDFMRYLRDLDVADNSISVRGRENTLIYVDDRKVSFEQLKSIDPSMIDRIEIIPHADASYGINARGGIVKVHLRSDGGLLGSVSMYGEADYYSPVRFSPGFNLLYSKGKISIGNFFDSRPYERYRQEYSETSVDEGVKNETHIKGFSYGRSLDENLSFRYSFNKFDRIDVYGGVGIGRGDSRQTSVSSDSETKMSTNDNNRNYNAGLKFVKGLSADGKNYFVLKTEYNKSFENTDNRYAVDITSDIAHRKYNLDGVSVEPYVSVDLTKMSTLSAGLNYYYLIDRHQSQGTETLDYVSDMRFVNKGHDCAAWASYGITIGKLYMRAELNYMWGEQIYKDYLSPENNVTNIERGLFPTFVFQWNINQDKGRFLNIGYFRYYSYPNYYYRSPEVVWQNSQLYSVGNPSLKMQTYNQMQVYFSLNKSWSADYSMDFGNDLVKVLMQPDGSRPGVYFTRPENAGTSMNHTLRLTYSGRLFSFWYSRNTLGAVYMEEKMPGRKVSNANISFRTDNDFTIYKGIGLTMAMSATSKTETLSYENNATYKINFGAYASLLKDKLSLNFVWSNVFYNRNKMKMYGDGWEVTRLTLHSRTRLMLTATWNFSLGAKIKKVNLPTSSGMYRETPTL